MQAVEDLGQRQRPHPRRGQLDRQRQAVEAPADLGDGGELSSVTVKSGRARRARSVNSSIASSASDSDGTRQVTSPATPIGSRLVASTVNLGAAASSAPSSSAQRVEQVLAVVQHHQHLTVGARTAAGCPSSNGRMVGQPQRRATVTGTTSAIGDRCQIDVPHPVSEIAGHLLRRPAPPAGSYPHRRPGQGDQPVACQSNRAAEPISASRPTKLVSWAGRLLRCDGWWRVAAAESRCAGRGGTAAPRVQGAADPAAGGYRGRSATHRRAAGRRPDPRWCPTTRSGRRGPGRAAARCG